jgi:16S rRNA (cytosine1402-N4)-methyltransferase
MLKEVLEYLNPKSGQYFIDCTLGGGGYTLTIAKKAGVKGRVLAIDMDKSAINNAEQIINKTKIKNIITSYGNFKNLQKIVEEKFKKRKAEWSGIIFDLGLSSAQLEDKSRGFSFQLDAPLIMEFARPLRFAKRFGRGIGDQESGGETTEDIVNKYKEEDLVKIIRDYGEEKYAKRIAQKIVEYRKNKQIKTTSELVNIIESAVPTTYKNNRRQGHRNSGAGGARKIHFATRTFQALRIATNKELENLEIALPQAINLLKKGGKLIVISYHSLEDRIVKQFIKKESKDCLCAPDIPICQCGHKAKLKIITKNIIVPSEDEIKLNPRARSARMRVAEKI